MLQWLTPAERRGATVLVFLLLLGAGRDMWVAHRMRREMVSAPSALPAEPLAPPVEGPPPAPATVPAPPVTARLDVNHASAEELDALPGIGPVLARRIVETRRESGRFESPEDLLRVRGVGPRLLERLRPRIEVGMHSAPSPLQGRADSTSVTRTSSR